jgi:hypothetical protein
MDYIRIATQSVLPWRYDAKRRNEGVKVLRPFKAFIVRFYT